MKFKLFLSLALFSGLFFVACQHDASKHQHDAAATTAADPNAVYACPMHPDVTGKAGDQCSKCGMDMVAMQMPAGGPEQYKVTFAATPAAPAAGQPVKMTFTPTIVDKPGQAVPLDVMHEKKMHLIMVSSDLAWFDHQHPEYNGTGLDLTYTFPKGGDYLLFADYAPSGAGHQLEKIPVTVSGAPAKPVTFSAAKTTVTVDGYEVSLTPSGGKWVTNNTLHIAGAVKKGGKPVDVNTFENYLGAKAHVVMIGLADKNYEHVHPDVEGNAFDLHTEFKTPGVYRAWLQFQTEGKVHTADFVIQVQEGQPGETTQPEGHGDHDHDHDKEGDHGHKH